LLLLHSSHALKPLPSTVPPLILSSHTKTRPLKLSFFLRLMQRLRNTTKGEGSHIVAPKTSTRAMMMPPRTKPRMLRSLPRPNGRRSHIVAPNTSTIAMMMPPRTTPRRLRSLPRPRRRRSHTVALNTSTRAMMKPPRTTPRRLRSPPGPRSTEARSTRARITVCVWHRLVQLLVVPMGVGDEQTHPLDSVRPRGNQFPLICY
jgi:hypothetical protein